MMINGVHAIIYSRDPEADRAFFRDRLGLPNVDAGDGWLIFGLPPSELAVHPADEGGRHELYLMCDDIKRFVAQLSDVETDELQDAGWGLFSGITLPGGGHLGIYQPRHRRPENPD